MQYTGREQDADSGLYYYRARYYDPELGRFISEDPIGFGGGINFYAYVENNPRMMNDPYGLDGVNVSGTASLGGTGLTVGGSVRFSGVSEEPFDLQLIVTLTPGIINMIPETIFGQSDYSDIPSAGAELVRTTINVGYDSYTSTSSGISMNYNYGGGAGVLGLTGTVQDIGNVNAENNYGTAIRIGPQLGAIAQPEIVFTVSGREVLDIAGDGLGWVGDQISNGVDWVDNQLFGGSAGGFVLYPNRVNTNMQQSVYEK